MTYNMTLLTNMTTVSPGNFVCNINYLSSHFLAYVLIALVIAISLTLLIKKGYTMYSALPVSFFYGSVLASLGLLMTCQSKTAVPLSLVVILWLLTAIFIGIRVVIKGN